MSDEKSQDELANMHRMTIADSLGNIASGGMPQNRPLPEPTRDQPLWVAIRNRGKAIEFPRYERFIERVLCECDQAPRGHVTCEDTHPSAPSDQDRDCTAGSKYAGPSKGSRLEDNLRAELGKIEPHYHGVDAYDLLKTATAAFLLIECGIYIEETDPNMPVGRSAQQDLYLELEEQGRLENRAPSDIAFGSDPKKKIRRLLGEYLGSNQLPYINRILGAITPSELVNSPFCEGVLLERVHCPCPIELIWSYWQEEGMLVQVLNSISYRFQNRRSPLGGDGLAKLDVAPLHPLNNFLWGYIQKETERTSMLRRVYEYDHHYGLSLIGKSVPKLNSVDSRSKFLSSFHSLLNLASRYFRERSDLNKIPDGFRLLNTLKELHLLLAEGAHNQYGDMPWEARVEMLIQQWLLARPEMDRFLSHRQMVPYREVWEGRLDTAKHILSMSDVSSRHFNDLARFGENLLLSVRFGDWSDVHNENAARNWADYWREEIQGYIHAYRVATGVELSTEPVDTTMPSTLLQRQLTGQRPGA